MRSCLERMETGNWEEAEICEGRDIPDEDAGGLWDSIVEALFSHSCLTPGSLRGVQRYE